MFLLNRATPEVLDTCPCTGCVEFCQKREKYILKIRAWVKEECVRIRQSEILTAEDYSFTVNALPF